MSGTASLADPSEDAAVANERAYQPCRVSKWTNHSFSMQTLGFKTTYRQVRPNPYAVVAREDLQIHLFGIAGFDPRPFL